MKPVEIIFSDYILKFGFWPLILTTLMVLVTIIVTVILVIREIRS